MRLTRLAATTLLLIATSTACTSPQRRVVGLSVTPGTSSIALGLSAQYSATATYSDNSTADVTGAATWSVAAPSVLRLSSTPGAGGDVAAISQGSCTLTAAFGGVTGSTTVTAAPPVLVVVSVAPSDMTLAMLTEEQLTATAIFSDGSKQDVTAQADWFSSDTFIAAVSSGGAVSTLSAGLAAINASFGGELGAISVTVTSAVLTSIDITSPSPTVPLGTTLALAATGLFSDQSSQDITGASQWTSSDLQIATISAGVLTPLQPGIVTITTAAAGLTGTVQITVTAATLNTLLIQPNGATNIDGTTQQYEVFGIYSDGTKQELTSEVAWDSDTPSVATIAGGLLQPVSAGQTKVIATLQGLRVSTFAYVVDATITALSVTPSPVAIAPGLTVPLTATASYSNGLERDVSATASWASSDPSHAAVSSAAGSSGVVTAVSTGPATITATLNSTSASADLTVTSAYVTGIAVSPMVPQLAKGTQLAFVATGQFSDGTSRNITSEATWTTTSNSVASVSNVSGSPGLVSALSVGVTAIQANWHGVLGNSDLTVTSAVLTSLSISPASASVGAGGTRTLAAIGTLSDGTNQDLTSQVVWTSSAPDTADVSNEAGTTGLITGIVAGATTVFAATDGVSASTTVTVTPQ